MFLKQTKKIKNGTNLLNADLLYSTAFVTSYLHQCHCCSWICLNTPSHGDKHSYTAGSYVGEV